ncbi:hypothetical protein ACWA19_30180 [Bacillus toyonensis]
MKLKKTVSSLVLSAAILGSGATAAFAATQYVGGGNMELWNWWWFSLVKLLPRKQSSQIFSNRTILL